METVNIYEAKAKLSKLISQAAAGDDVIIGRNGKPVARLTQIEEKKRVVRFGLLKGKIKIAKDFDEPLPDEIIAAFQGG
jgi:prevent-host-death family protein